MNTTDPAWVQQYRWLIPILWWAAALSMVAAVLFTRWFRSLIVQRIPRPESDRNDRGAFQQQARDSASNAAVRSIGNIGQGAVVQIGTFTTPHANVPKPAPIQDPPQFPPLKFAGYEPLRSGPCAFVATFGRQHVTAVYVENYQLDSGREVCNARVSIQYLRNSQPEFTVREAQWFLLKPPPFTSTVDLAAKESQPFSVFMVGEGTDFPQSAMDQDGTTKQLGLGRWLTRITVSADFQSAIYGEIEFTVYREQDDPKYRVGCHPPMGVARLPVVNPSWTGSQ